MSPVFQPAVIQHCLQYNRYLRCSLTDLAAALVVFCFEGRNPSGSPSSLSIPVPRELLSAFIWRNIEPMFCSPLLSGVSPDDISTETDQRSRTEVHLHSALNLFYFRRQC